MTSHTLKPPTPLIKLRMTNAGELVGEKHPIGEIEVKSKEQPHMSLGNFSRTHPPKGFEIHISPDPEPDAIVTQITGLGADEEYELILQIANYGNKTVNAKIWPL